MGYRQQSRKNLIVGFLFSLCLTVILLEGGLRLLKNHSSLIHLLVHNAAVPTDYRNIHTVEGLLHSKEILLLPGGVFSGFRLNSRGFRTPEYTVKKPDGVRRIVILGDSFASDSGGVPVPDLWHMQAGQMLQKESTYRIEVINLGVPGVGPLFLERLFAIEGRTLQPDIVVIAFFIGNDLTDEGVREGDLYERKMYIVRLWRNIKKLWRSDAVMAQLLHQWKVFRDGGRMGGIQDTEYVYAPDEPTFGEEEYLEIERGRANMFLPSSRVNAKKLLTEAVETLQRLSEDVRHVGAEPLVMIIPDELQVNAALREAVLAKETPIQEAMDLIWIQDAINTSLGAKKVPVLDLVPIFQKQSQQKRLYKPRDTHWNDNGNLLATKELAIFIRQHPALDARL